MITSDGARLKAAERVFRQLPREVKNDLRKYQRKEVGPIWKSEVKTNLNANKLAAVVFKSGTSVKVGASMTLRAAGSQKKLSGGIVASELIPQAEFGSSRQNKYTKYNRISPKGKSHTVTRRTSRQLPHHRRGGYVVYRASGPSIQRITSLSVQTVTRRIYESIEGI
jgi:hypothetical protein